MKAIISYFRQKSSDVLNVITKHEKTFYTFVLTSIFFVGIIFYKNANHHAEVLNLKKDKAFLEQYLEDSSHTIGAQKQIIYNQEESLKRASQVINEQNVFIKKALERLKYFESLFADPDKWT